MANKAPFGRPRCLLPDRNGKKASYPNPTFREAAALTVRDPEAVGGALGRAA
jgi:hypothetical protein